MQRYIRIDNAGRITGIYLREIDNTIQVDVPEEVEFNPHKYKFIEGEFVIDTSEINNAEIEMRKAAFRVWRATRMDKYDLLRINILNGDYDPLTGQHYPATTEAEKQWRIAVLNFTDQITASTTEADYPQPTARLQ